MEIGACILATVFFQLMVIIGLLLLRKRKYVYTLLPDLGIALVVFFLAFVSNYTSFEIVVILSINGIIGIVIGIIWGVTTLIKRPPTE
jgi:hypothetical protein